MDTYTAWALSASIILNSAAILVQLSRVRSLEKRAAALTAELILTRARLGNLDKPGSDEARAINQITN